MPATAAALSGELDEDAPPKPGFGIGKILVVIVILGIVVLGGGGLLLVVVGGGALAVSSGAVSGGGASPTPPVEAPAEAKADVRIPAGGKVLKADDKKDVPRSKTLLTASIPEGAEVILQGPRGFKAEWDAKADFDIGDLAEGKYQTNITLLSGAKVRGKSFAVVGGKACKFSFDVGKSDWGGGCE
jgi:hypothetical protein